MAEDDDLSIPPTFPKSFYKLLSRLSVEFHISRPQLALRALRLFAEEARKQKSSFRKALGSEEMAARFSEAASKSAKSWWSTVSEQEKKERGRKAAEARWGKKK